MPATTRRGCEPLGTTHRAEPPRKYGGRASRRRERGGTTKPAPGAPAGRRRQRRCARRATGTALREQATAPTTTRREREPLSTTNRAERTSCRHGRVAAERHAAESAASGAPAWRCRQRRRERCATATAPSARPIAPTITCRERGSLSTTHCAKSTICRHGRAAAVRHTAVSAGTRPTILCAFRAFYLFTFPLNSCKVEIERDSSTS